MYKVLQKTRPERQTSPLFGNAASNIRCQFAVFYNDSLDAEVQYIMSRDKA
jgi:hypothetical protein